MAVYDVTEADFKERVIDRSHDVPVVVDFWAAWCGPCRQLTPALEKAAGARDGRVDLAKVDTDANQELAGAFDIRGIPAVKAFRDGKVANEFTGAAPPAQVESFFDALVPSEADELAASGEEADLRRALERLQELLQAEPDRERRDLIRRAMVGLFTELGPDDPLAREHRRRLSAALN